MHTHPPSTHGAHGHAHTHHAPDSWSRAFAIGIALNAGFVAIEVLFGLYADSLALLADAGHNLSDVFALVLAWGALRLSQTRPTERRTYGLRRSSQFASLVNGVVLLMVSGIIAWEALGRLLHPTPVGEITVIWVAAVGVVINTATALLFMRGQSHDLNIRGAFLHMAADAAISLGVVLSGVIVFYTGWYPLDPLVGLLIVAVIVYGTWGLLRESLDLMLDAVPHDIDAAAVRDYLEATPGIASLHDLHIWATSTTETALTAHLVKRDDRLDDALLTQLADELKNRFGIRHVTIQLEHGDAAHPCPLDGTHDATEHDHPAAAHTHNH
ncbi:cation diffusion facilitator family transporter [Acidihalobacter ferrooxydans]|uniref:Cation transporter n=1 Tax=Acidihalobacter ferrooxydans TaxID=1765967 RepID=A0A1P8UJ38_9GAMM|nr:cation diffusion facilitator family transporter [Acidihalobacter ferrooxydans]APZ43833.1 cation transporter [Acidihalobacter ferrooxydans]